MSSSHFDGTIRYLEYIGQAIHQFYHHVIKTHFCIRKKTEENKSKKQLEHNHILDKETIFYEYCNYGGWQGNKNIIYRKRYT